MQPHEGPPPNAERERQRRLTVSLAGVIAVLFIALLWAAWGPLEAHVFRGQYENIELVVKLWGLVFLSHQVGSFLGGWAPGRLYDISGSYDAMWWISIGLGLLAAAIHWFISEQPVARLRAQPVPA